MRRLRSVSVRVRVRRRECRHGTAVVSVASGSGILGAPLTSPSNILSGLSDENRRLRERLADYEGGVVPPAETLSKHAVEGSCGASGAACLPSPPTSAAGDEHTLAERIVKRIFVTPLAQGDSGGLRARIHEQLGTCADEDVEDALLGGSESLRAPTTTCAIWPSKALARQLIKMYFEATNPFYPTYDQDVINKEWVIPKG